MNIYDRLKVDHDLQRELAVKLCETSDESPKRRRLWEQFRPEAEAHASAEEQAFYSILIEASISQPKARHGVHEHKLAVDQIAELSQLDLASPDWIVKFKGLMDELEQHMQAEELEVFPKARRVIPEKVSQLLAVKFERRKWNELQRVWRPVGPDYSASEHTPGRIAATDRPH